MVDRTQLPQRRTAQPPVSRDWKILPLVLVPIACCGLPLLLATIGAAGALAVGGVAAAVLILVTGVLVFALQRQRRRPRNPSVSIPQAGERQKS